MNENNINIMYVYVLIKLIFYWKGDNLIYDSILKAALMAKREMWKWEQKQK
jgi:hypothetical protein